jgi:hypothetical protein
VPLEYIFLCAVTNRQAREQRAEFGDWKRILAMDNLPASYRSDAQLLAMLDETADWFASDASGLTLWRLTSLRDALEKAKANMAAGQVVREMGRLPPKGVIVFASQLGRIVSLLDARREVGSSHLSERKAL